MAPRFRAALRGTWFGARIAIVDDEPGNVLLLERLLEQAGYTNVVSTTDSSRAQELLAGSPDLILLDLQMPAPDGYAILEHLLPAREPGGFLPVLVLTADSTRPARERALSLGATDFLVKPFDPIEVQLRIRNLLEMRHVYLELAQHNRILDERVHERTRELDQARLETLRHLAVAAEYRDDDTHQHALRVGRTAALIAERIQFREDQSRRIRDAAPLHDIGKLAVPDAILRKPDRLTHDEYESMKTHTVTGAQILTGSRSRVLQMAEEIALMHHERWDGSGYPRGIRGEEIALSGRIVAIADVFDALTHARPYKQAWPVGVAVTHITEAAGEQFDPTLVSAFLDLDHEALLEWVGLEPAPTAEESRSRTLEGT